MSIAVVVACCGNGLRIPCLTFATVEEADAMLTGIFGSPSRGGRYGGNKNEEEMYHLAEKFWTGYYDGCGGVYGYVVEEVDHGEPFIRFSLD